jgi:hypothetical protein
LVAAAVLALAGAPGSAVAAATSQHPARSLRLAKQATSFDRTAKAAATLAALEIRWETAQCQHGGDAPTSWSPTVA